MTLHTHMLEPAVLNTPTNSTKHAYESSASICLDIVKYIFSPFSSFVIITFPSPPPSPFSSIVAHHNRQRLKHNLVLLIMSHEAPLQDPLQPLQPRQLPPLVDPHVAALAHPYHQPRPVPSSRFVVDGVLIPGPAGRVFDAVQDVRETRAEGFAVGFAKMVGAD